MGISNFKKYDTFPAYADIQTIDSSITTTLTLDADYSNDLILANTSSASISITIPTNTTATIPIGRTFTIIQLGANQVFIFPEAAGVSSGATPVSIYVEPNAIVTPTSSPNRVSTRGQYSKLTFVKIADNIWVTEGYGNYVQQTEPLYPVVGDTWIF